jgi:hypothetical protein
MLFGLPVLWFPTNRPATSASGDGTATSTNPPVPNGWFAVGAYAQGGNTRYAYGSPVEYPILLVQATLPASSSRAFRSIRRGR